MDATSLGERKGLGGLTGGLATIISADPASDRGGTDGLGVVGVGASGMPGPSTKDPVFAHLQSRQAGTCGSNTVADSNSTSLAAGNQSNAAAAMQPQIAPVKRRPRPAVEAAVAMLHDLSHLQLTQPGVQSYPATVYGDQQAGVGGAGAKGFQLDWPLQPQPVNAAQGHLSSAAAKLSSAATRYTNAVNAASYSKRAAAFAADAADAASAQSINSSIDPGSPQDGRRSKLSRRSAQSLAQSSDTVSSQLDPFAPRPRLAVEQMLNPSSSSSALQPSATAHQPYPTAQQSTASAQSMSSAVYSSPSAQRGQLQSSASKKGQLPAGAGPARRALFPANLDDWSISASRNLDAPEMGSPPESDGEESTSGSSEVQQRFASTLVNHPWSIP